jgi:bifunctional enzyme CysN/CysC
VQEVSGREPLAREMASVASAAEVALVVVDAREDIGEQARRQGCVAFLFGVPHVVVAVDGMHEVQYSEARFNQVRSAWGDFAQAVGLRDVTCVPLSVREGDNLTERSTRMAWYRGPTLVEWLEGLPARRGDSAKAPDERSSANVETQFEATIVWMGDAPLLPGRDYRMKIGTRTVTATVTPLKHKLNFETLEHVAATKLEAGEVGVVQLELDQPVGFAGDDLRGFLLVDRITGDAAAAGMIRFALRRSQNVHWQAVDIDRAARAAMKGQRPCVLWFTGLSGAGKSTIANLVEKKLHAMGRHTYLLDGDNVRHGLNKDLGFTEAARVENIRRVSEVARLMADAGLVVITAFISPFRSERASARALFPDGEFLEVFVDTPLAVAEQRDPKGLYGKARRGELRNFTGIDSPYERPEDAEIRIDTTTLSAEAAAARIVEEMRLRGL